ncbi:Hint domain-containing protein [Gemmobacter denitrificans]|uniref:Hint domain-containing protein n=1 Tax=Gemmobacter denitrificans TaxID=3123040 RepID=A0ABU8BRG5_9RHOB
MHADSAPAPTSLPGQACMVFPAEAIYVVNGVNQGDPLAPPDEVCHGDIYLLDRETEALRLVLDRSSGMAILAAGSQCGEPGTPLQMLCRYTLMGDDGDKVALLLLAIPGEGHFALPLSPMGAGIHYTLVHAEEAPESTHLSDLLCVSFLRGTAITKADGSQSRIETLIPGDRVLTRDHGPQPIRWIGRATLRAVGPFAPVVITAGAMGNAGDLIVSQHHRMFLYQRQRIAGSATSELLVQARHLVNEETIFLREGGYADYFSLVFDRHEIIYAEGIPAESLLVTEATLSRLPVELSAEVKARFPGLNQNQHFGSEAGRNLLEALEPQLRARSRGGR